MKALTLSHLGKRPTNQDLLLEQTFKDGSSLFAVNDGMGGYEHGEIAAQLIVDSMSTYLSSVDIIDSFQIQKAINKSNLFIRQRNIALLGNMAATIGGIFIREETVIYFWVGDVKIFHFRNGGLIFESSAHTLVSELVENKSILDPAKLSRYKHVVTRAIQGDVKLSQAELYSGDFDIENDILIVCSDGVHDLFDGLQFANMIERSCNSPTLLFELFKSQLPDLAVDNATVAVIGKN